MNVTESNKLIAEFMGAKFRNVSNSVRQDYIAAGGMKTFAHFPSGQICEVSNLKYNRSWDHIMPVIAKINEQSIAPALAYDMRGALLNVDIDEVYNRVMQILDLRRARRLTAKEV